jgi:hypothetical protein
MEESCQRVVRYESDRLQDRIRGAMSKEGFIVVRGLVLQELS